MAKELSKAATEVVQSMILLCVPDESCLQSKQLQQLDPLFCTTLKVEFLKFQECVSVCLADIYEHEIQIIIKWVKLE